MPTPMSWTNERVLRLIEEFRSQRALWDTEASDFRAHAARVEAWTALARAFGCEVAELRKKMNSVFASYRRERVRVRAGGRSRWFAYQHLDFLPSHITSPPTGGSPRPRGAPNKIEEHYTEEVAVAEQLEDEEDEEDEDKDLLLLVKSEPSPSPPPPPEPRRRAPRSSAASASRSHPYRRRATCPVAPEAVRVRERARDECDAFGEYIARALRKHDERTRAMIKHAIGNILFEQEMKRFAARNPLASRTSAASDD